MVWNLNMRPIFPCEYIEPTVILIVQVLAPHQCPDFSIIIKLLQTLSILRSVIVQVHYVICCSSLVLLPCLIQVNPSSNPIRFILFLLFHSIPPILIFPKPFSPQVMQLCLVLIIHLFPHFLVNHCKVFVKTISL